VAHRVRKLAMLTTLSTEHLIAAEHPIRKIRRVVHVILAELDRVFDRMYASGGRKSLPRKALLKALVVMAMGLSSPNCVQSRERVITDPLDTTR
jgi:hypothetical protein